MGGSHPLKEVKTFDVSNSSNITQYTALACPNESSTKIDPNSLAKHFRDFTTNSEFKVCLQRHTI